MQAAPRDSKQTPLTVYNCGNAHAVSLFHFLAKIGYYTGSFHGWNDFEDKNRRDEHCVRLPSFRLDLFLKPFMTHPQQRQVMFTNYKRAKILGSKVFNNLLKGRKVTLGDLETNRFVLEYAKSTDQTLEQVLKELNFQTVCTVTSSIF